MNKLVSKFSVRRSPCSTYPKSAPGANSVQCAGIPSGGGWSGSCGCSCAGFAIALVPINIVIRLAEVVIV